MYSSKPYKCRQPLESVRQIMMWCIAQCHLQGRVVLPRDVVQGGGRSRRLLRTLDGSRGVGSGRPTPSMT